MNKHQAHICAICKAPNASFGYGFSGSWNELPDDKRGTLWVCGDPECRKQALDRKNKAEGKL